MIPQQGIHQSEQHSNFRAEEVQSSNRPLSSMRRPMRVSRSSIARSKDTQQATTSTIINSSGVSVSKDEGVGGPRLMHNTLANAAFHC